MHKFILNYSSLIRNKQMSKKQKLNKKLRHDIEQIFLDSPKSVFNYKQISGLLEISDKALRKLVFEILTDLVDAGVIKETARGKFRSVAKQKLIEGVVDAARRGIAYVITPDFEDDIFISAGNRGQSMHGDKVRVALIKGGRNRKKMEGRIVEVLDRDKRRIVGNLEVHKKHAFLVPDDTKMEDDIYIPISKLKGGKTGEKAIARITDWPKMQKVRLVKSPKCWVLQNQTTCK